MFKRRVASIGIVLVCASLLGYVGKCLYDLNRRLKCEYATADVIREVTEYVNMLRRTVASRLEPTSQKASMLVNMLRCDSKWRSASW